MHLNTDTIEVGDWIGGSTIIGSERHGPVDDIYPYRCSRNCTGCGGKQCPHVAGWRVARFRSGIEITLSGGSWPGAYRVPADGSAAQPTPTH